jgi:hypothetical protein
VTDDRVSAELAAIRQRHANSEIGGLQRPTVAQIDAGAEDVPRLLAAVEAALELHRMHRPDADGLRACPTLAAIERALTGEDGSDHG